MATISMDLVDAVISEVIEVGIVDRSLEYHTGMYAQSVCSSGEGSHCEKGIFSFTCDNCNCLVK